MKQNGFSAILVTIIIGGIIVTGGLYNYYYKNNNAQHENSDNRLPTTFPDSERKDPTFTNNTQLENPTHTDYSDLEIFEAANEAQTITSGPEPEKYQITVEPGWHTVIDKSSDQTILTLSKKVKLPGGPVPEYLWDVEDADLQVWTYSISINTGGISSARCEYKESYEPGEYVGYNYKEYIEWETQENRVFRREDFVNLDQSNLPLPLNESLVCQYRSAEEIYFTKEGFYTYTDFGSISYGIPRNIDTRVNKTVLDEDILKEMDKMINSLELL